MTNYATREIALTGGEPVEAVHFLVNGVNYRYTSADRQLTIDGNVFEPLPMNRATFVLTGDSVKSDLVISLPRDVLVAYVSGVTSVTVWRGHDPYYLVYWKGRVIGREFAGSLAKFRCESIFTSLRRPGLRAKYQVMCRHVLFGEGCRADRTVYQAPATVTAVSGVDLSTDLSGFSAAWFVGGHLTFGPYSRMIVGQAGGTLQMDRGLPGVAIGSAIVAYPGCDHSMEHCANKYDNLLNFGGFPWIPLSNPFSGLGNRLA